MLGIIIARDFCTDCAVIFAVISSLETFKKNEIYVLY